ncbi:MAG TPA: alpha/beta fold hydrolase [Micromonosporaceae bacterium]
MTTDTGPRRGLDAGAQTTTRYASDGVEIDACHDVGPSKDLAIVVAHGFTGSWRRPALRRAVAGLTQHAGVVSFDFRGHGRSGGASTVGDREVLDLQAALDWATELDYARVATVGFSMGASIVVRHAGLRGLAEPAAQAHGPVAVVAVSGPARWYYRGTPAMRRAHWVIERPLGRLVGRLARGTRIAAHGWDPVPAAPHEVAGHIAPVPLLIVHGDADHYFPVEHAEQLFGAANHPKELWLEPGFGHAESAASPQLVDRIGAWVRTAALDPR